MDLPPLTDVQARVLDFIRRSIRSGGRSPSLREIQAEFRYGSPNTARFHVSNLVEAGYLLRGSGHRGLQLNEPSGLSVLGTVAAGSPIEAVGGRGEHLDIDGFPGEGPFALRGRGGSVVGEGVAGGGYVVVRKQETCSDGDLVVARIGEEATLKRFYRETKRQRGRLQPANSTMEPIFCRAEDMVIEGGVVGVIRLMPNPRPG